MEREEFPEFRLINYSSFQEKCYLKPLWSLQLSENFRGERGIFRVYIVKLFNFENAKYLKPL